MIEIMWLQGEAITQYDNKLMMVVMMMECVLMCRDAGLRWDMKSQNHDPEMLFPFLYQNPSCQPRETTAVPSTAAEMLNPRHISQSRCVFVQRK